MPVPENATPLPGARMVLTDPAESPDVPPSIAMRRSLHDRLLRVASRMTDAELETEIARFDGLVAAKNGEG